jgi:two-component system chemotaxis sensor kinase CheA
MAVNDKHRQVFLEEAAELLVEIESALLELEERPDDEDLIGRVFRAMHTIKGSGAMFGFEAASKFTHELETVFDQVRNKRMSVTKELISLTLTARDRIKELIDAPDNVDDEQRKKNAELIAELKKLCPAAEAPAAKTVAAPAPQEKEEPGTLITYRIKFKPARNVFLNGADPVLLLEELATLGSTTVIASTEEIPFLDVLDAEKCFTSWSIVLTTDRDLNAVKDVFLFVQDDAEIKIETVDRVDASQDVSTQPYAKRVGDILVEHGEVTPEVVQQALSTQKRFGQILVNMGAAAPAAVATALAEQTHARDAREKRQKEESALSVRVPAEKLDRLVDLVGELVTVQARLSQAAADRKKSQADYLAISEEVERLTAELRDNTMSIRMLPIGTTFSKFKRLVRDLSGELGKEIELNITGAETELDKTVIERLGDPLVHLIRNSIDHGIESPADREAAGKPRQGTIHLVAAHSGANVLIRITDDGAGIDTEAVRAKAIERGIIEADAVLSEQDSFQLLFAPGFSTAKKVTNVSGRGVGMDVVKKTIDSLRGTIEISSEKGRGSTITLKLPLTLAIIDGFLTRINDDHFVFPLSLVEECVELSDADRKNAHGRDFANVRGQIVPYIRLRDQFGIIDRRPEIEQIVITRVNDRRVGFVVDHVVGGHQTVIKNLGKFYHRVEGVSGATILGNGSVALILDVPKLAQNCEREALAVR